MLKRFPSAATLTERRSTLTVRRYTAPDRQDA